MGYDSERLSRIYDKTDGYCHLCNKKLSYSNYDSHGAKGAWHVDHSKAKANGGTNHMNNLFAACINCNNEKGTLHKSTIRKRKGYENEQSSGGCYITTACMANKGLSDDCYQLQVLRNFRDTFVLSKPEGKEMVTEYYQTAPLIVDAINKRKDANKIYDKLFTEIEHAVSLVEQKLYSDAFELYCKLLQTLNSKYLHTNHNENGRK